ncbi:DUF2336 domain-containing protein [Stappia stellulata]|uniref:DUF2336 domain-containing protein n=1 Tax=Stappia TaxID=152161 RepID=UPI001CD2673E|nr:DUF2336 domain-containing protein [Stappia stellulata]MCA1242520.1 DUF2336 domain-containing protein [Stappia stellulata]
MFRERLEELARIREPSARSELVRLLSAQYADKLEREPSDTERFLFSSLVLDVFDQLDHSVRLDIVVRLARTDRITSALADRLATEAFDLSEAILEHSPVISDEKLVDVVRSRSDRHRLAIARRDKVPEKIVDALIARGAFPVVNALLQNDGAQFAVRAMLALLILSNGDQRLLGAMAQRCINDEEFREDLRLVSQTDCPLMPAELEKALDDCAALERIAQRTVIDDRDAGLEIEGEHLSKHEVRIQIASGELSFENILLTLMEREDMPAIIWLVSRHLNLRDSTVRDTFASQADGAVAMLMKETGIGHKTYGKFLKLRCAWLGVGTTGVAHEVYTFRTMRHQGTPRAFN